MISFLRGRVHDKQPNTVTIDVGGVGYEVHVPLSTFYEAGEPGADISLRIHTHVREETLSLFGFGTARELEIHRVRRVQALPEGLPDQLFHNRSHQAGWRTGTPGRWSRPIRLRMPGSSHPVREARRSASASCRCRNVLR